jgi:hypothetical protein
MRYYNNDPNAGEHPAPNEGDWFTQNAPPPPPSTGAPGGVVKDPRNAAGRGTSAEQYYRDYITNFGVHLKQSDPAGWAKLVADMRNEGYDVSLDSRPDGMHKGIMLNGQFVKLADGNDNPIWLPGGDQGGGGDKGLGGFGVPETPYASQPYTGPAYTTPATPVTNTPFVAPTAITMENDPGFKFRRDEGNQAMERSAAAKGSILSGGTQKALAQYNQDYASNEFQNVFNRALGTQQQNVGQEAAQVGNYNTQYTNRYNDWANQNQRTLGDYLTNYNVQRGGSTDFYNLYYNPTQNRALQAAGSTGGQ